MFAVIEKLAEDPSAPADKPTKTSFSKQIQSEKATAIERLQAAAQKFAANKK